MRMIWPARQLLFLRHLHEHAVEAVEIADDRVLATDVELRVHRREVAVVLEHGPEAAAELVLARTQLVGATLGAVGADQRHRQARALRLRHPSAHGRPRRRHGHRSGRRDLVHAEAAGATEPERRRDVGAARRAAAHTGRRGRRARGRREARREARDAGRRSHRGLHRGTASGAPPRGPAACRASRAIPRRSAAAGASAAASRPTAHAAAHPRAAPAPTGPAIIVFIIPTSPPRLGYSRQLRPAAEAELVVILVFFSATIADSHGGSDERVGSDDFDAK